MLKDEKAASQVILLITEPENLPLKTLVSIKRRKQ
jgi:hypothetical protein